MARPTIQTKFKYSQTFMVEQHNGTIKLCSSDKAFFYEIELTPKTYESLLAFQEDKKALLPGAQ